jgi:hypothetical protein
VVDDEDMEVQRVARHEDGDEGGGILGVLAMEAWCQFFVVVDGMRQKVVKRMK